MESVFIPPHIPVDPVSKAEKRALENETIGSSKRQKRIIPRKDLHHLTMQKKYIHQIREGTKTVEGRINNRSIPKLMVGDKIRFYYFTDSKDDVTCEIVAIRHFASFQEMLLNSGYQNCISDCSGIEEAVQTYDKIPNYTERAKTFGVAGIHIKTIQK